MSQQPEQEVLLDKEGFKCIICQATAEELVSLPCEHSLCSSCLEGPQDQDQNQNQNQDQDQDQGEKPVYSCPHCKQVYSPTLCVKRKHVLSEVVEEPMDTESVEASPSVSLALTEDVVCDFCILPSCNKAITSCLACFVSFCETHQQPHYDRPELKAHKLIKATVPLQKKLCPDHNKLLEVFCRTDQQCICYQCATDKHKDHETLATAAERMEKQKQLSEMQEGVHQRIQETEKKLEELRQTVETMKSSTQTALEASERIFIELLQAVERRRMEVKELISTQEASVRQAEGVLRRLEQEMAELRKTDADLKELHQTDDHIAFIESFKSLPSPSTPLDLPSITIPSPLNLREVGDFIFDFRDKLRDFLNRNCPTTTPAKAVGALAPVEHRTREYLLQYAFPLSVDLNTVNNRLSLSEDNRKVTVTDKWHPYPEHAERFTFWWETLLSEGQSGRLYWEVEWSGAGACIAVAYKDIRRTGFVDQSRFGYNDKSWSLECSPEGYRFRHNNVRTDVTGPQSSKIGVYLDHSAGTLSFYSISDTVTHLHTVQAKFDQVLYPGLWIYGVNSTAELCQIW